MAGFLHLMSFLAPALAVSLLVAGAARVLWPGSFVTGSWWASVAFDFLAGAAASTASLWYWGRDGKMAGYAAMVLAVATMQWLLVRGWRAGARG